MTKIFVTKHAPDGRPSYRYPARLIEQRPGWIVVEADWPMREVVAGPISFKPGDRLIEFFSTDDYFNAFRIIRETDTPAGWYCNITLPTSVQGNEIHWHDLYLDIIIDPCGVIHIEDEDELDTSGMEENDPKLYEAVIDAKHRLIALIEQHEFPFSVAG